MSSARLRENPFTEWSAFEQSADLVRVRMNPIGWPLGKSGDAGAARLVLTSHGLQRFLQFIQASRIVLPLCGFSTQHPTNGK